MKCVRHNDAETVATCSKCGAGVCADCVSLSKDVRESCGTLCANCYTEVLGQARASITAERGKKLKRAIISVICYVIGLVVLVIAYTSEELNIMMMLVGFLLCGIYTGLTWAKAAQEAHDAYERKHGASYSINYSSGTITKDTGLGTKVMYLIMGTFFGIVATPCRVITDLTGAARLKKELAEFDAEIERAKSF